MARCCMLLARRATCVTLILLNARRKRPTTTWPGCTTCSNSTVLSATRLTPPFRSRPNHDHNWRSPMSSENPWKGSKRPIHAATAWIALAFGIAVMAQVAPAYAEKNYGPGVSDSEIKIGQTMPYSGPLSGMGTHGRAMAAYFAKINQEGGVNGRKLTLISLDDGYSPPKTVEH